MNLQLDAIFEALPELLDGADDEARSESRIYAPNPAVSQSQSPLASETCTSQDRNHIFPPLFVYLKNFPEVWKITDENDMFMVLGVFSNICLVIFDRK